MERYLVLAFTLLVLFQYSNFKPDKALSCYNFIVTDVFPLHNRELWSIIPRNECHEVAMYACTLNSNQYQAIDLYVDIILRKITYELCQVCPLKKYEFNITDVPCDPTLLLDLMRRAQN